MHESLSFQHYIFTLFNYKSDYPNLDERISIFREYTLPSVLAQTEGRFKWLIVINPDHEPLFRDLDPRIILLHKESNLGKNFIEYINKDFSSEYLVTSRIDNDDLLRNDAFEIKIKNFQEDPSSKIIDSSGYRMNGSGSKIIEFNMYGPERNSPFSTAVKKIKSAITKQDTVYCTKHGILYTEFNNVSFIKERLWIQLIHGTNKVNRGMSGKEVNGNILKKFLP